MTSTSMQSNLALQGMDEEGFLTPSAKTAVRLRLEEAEPLLASDEGLALQLSRVLGIAGIGNGERWVHACRETRNLFEEVEVTLRNLLPVADLKVEEIVLGAQIHALCESRHRFDLGFRMARNGRHTADEYRKTSNFLDTLSHEIQRLNDVLLTQLPGEEGGGICALVRELSHLPMLIARQNNLSFELRHDIPLRSGDTFTLDGSSRFLVLERQEDGHLRLISHSYSDNPYEQVFLHEKIVYDAATIISRGGRNELYISREPFSSFQPILDGSHVIASPFDETRRDYAFGECISLRKTGGRDLAGLERKVLWHLHDGSARLEEFKESNLRTLDPRSDGRNGAQSVLSKSRYEALSAIAKSVENLPAQRDRESRELQALCNAVLQAELPIALHIMGSAYACRKHEALNSLSSTMVQVTTEGLPTEDPNHLRAHMCIPVLLVLESEKETALHSQIVELKKKGWEVIVVQNEDSLPDYFIKWAIEDNGVRVPEEQFTVIESTSGDVAERIGCHGCGARAWALAL